MGISIAGLLENLVGMPVSSEIDDYEYVVIICLRACIHSSVQVVKLEPIECARHRRREFSKGSFNDVPWALISWTWSRLLDRQW